MLCRPCVVWAALNGFEIQVNLGVGGRVALCHERGGSPCRLLQQACPITDSTLVGGVHKGDALPDGATVLFVERVTEPPTHEGQHVHDPLGWPHCDVRTMCNGGH